MTRQGTGKAVLILGGGVAGLASAVAHRERGWDVRLVEARDRLGGRAWSFPEGHPRAGLDNGPHVALGCYRAFRRLLTALGSEGAFHRPDTLRFAWLVPGGAFESLDPPGLPAPFHLVAALLGLGSILLDERLDALLSCLAPWLGRPRAGEGVAAWLRRGGHGRSAADLLLDPLCRAVMNEEPEDADARLFAATLREAFAQRRAAI